MYQLRFQIIIVFIFIAQNLSGQSEKIASYFSELHNSGDFNGSALIVQGDSIVYSGSFGFANSSQQVLNNEERYGIGSIYKEFTGVALMQLVEKGEVKLSDPLDQYLKGLPSWSAKISLGQILKYQGGFPQINFGNLNELSSEVLMNELMQMESLVYKEGTDYLYTNFSPFIISKVIENVTHLSYKEYIQKFILDPLGMDQTKFKLEFPYKDRTQVAIPMNESFMEDQIPFIVKDPLFLLLTTPYDLYLFTKALHNDQLISRQSLLTLGRKANIDIENIQSALGNLVVKDNRIISHIHHGSSGNYECLLNKDLERDVTIILFTNIKRRNLFDISTKVTKIVQEKID